MKVSSGTSDIMTSVPQGSSADGHLDSARPETLTGQGSRRSLGGDRPVVAWIVLAVALAGAASLTAFADRASILRAIPSLGAAVAIALVVWRRHPLGASAWLLIAAGQALMFTSRISSSTSVASGGPEGLVPLGIEVAADVVAAWGLLVLARHHTRAWDRTRWIDSVTVTIGAALCGGALLARPRLPADASWLMQWVHPVAPALALGLVLLSVRAVLAARKRPWALRGLVLGLVLQFAGDALTGWVFPVESPWVQNVRSLLMGASAFLLVAAVLDRSTGSEPVRAIPWRRLGPVRLLVLSISFVAPLAVLVGLQLRGDAAGVEAVVLAAGAAVVGVLALVRVSGLVTYADTLADERHRSRFETLAAHGRDAVMVVNTEQIVTWASSAVGPVLLLGPEKAVGRRLSGVLGDDAGAQAEDALRALAGEPPGSTARVGLALDMGSDTPRTIEGTAINLADDPAVEGLVLVVRDTTERTVLRHKLDEVSDDALTGLATRRTFTGLLDEKLASGTVDTPVAVGVLFIDLDDFKDVNDNHGHVAGDDVLIRVARVLEGAIRPSDTAARLGGDEFAVIVESASSEALARVAHRILQRMGTPFDLDGEAVTVSASIGGTVTDGAWLSVRDLLDRADQAMYEAKRAGKAQYRVLTDPPAGSS